MRGISSIIDISGYLLMVSGLIHIAAFVASGFTHGIYGLAPVGVLFVVLGYLLQRTEWRWLGYIAYIGVGIGVSFVIRDFFISLAAPTWWYLLIIILDVLAVVALFFFLWRSPKPRAAAA